MCLVSLLPSGLRLVDSTTWIRCSVPTSSSVVALPGSFLCAIVFVICVRTYCPFLGFLVMPCARNNFVHIGSQLVTFGSFSSGGSLKDPSLDGGSLDDPSHTHMCFQCRFSPRDPSLSGGSHWWIHRTLLIGSCSLWDRQTHRAHAAVLLGSKACMAVPCQWFSR